METTTRFSVSYLLKDVEIRYLGLVVVFAVAVRLIFAIFKTYGAMNGEVIEAEEEPNPLKDMKFWILYKRYFKSSPLEHRSADCWIPFFIGMFEMFTYPLFMANGLWELIGGWIGIKAVSMFTGRNIRTAHNRFIIGNILSLVASGSIALICF